ncbi:MAG TPA: 3'(2'),5'-bisphosphate nucleotidase CysQ [Caulobacteraceae bacterium]|nr:3'(2'),5'-bisphosphate nucleotidase CysQ [Caulobacteraceae bacterium]
MSDLDAREIGEALADIVVEASRLILPLWRSGLAVEAKKDESPVTEADRRGEALILERLAKVFPGVPVISEEDASQFGTPETIGPRFFLVDPLDGTKAFVRGDPHFTVNIGYVENRRSVAGAVAAPPSGELWHTSRGVALKRHFDETEARPVRVRPWPKDAAIALTSHTMKEETAEKLAAQYGFHIKEPMDSSIKFCRIAEGAADIYPRHGPTMEWDICAGHAVLEAAGGSVLTPEGEPFAYGKAADGFRNGWFVARGG